MSYQVLARKYRPGHFKAMEGQGHVLQALINALDQNRLHHAYLFTGTRGVGKTTIARIFAKCLNCEQGITSEPCGVCASCVEISEGRSVDLIEVDAASRTGVDDMRDLLDNVQYLPTASRFKVYLIDEVHMLSKSSFNAMLKTLEEPPEHVKFLFATTDPKKLPITVLSRCLQFNLKNMTPERVVHYLQWVLAEESIDAEEEALWQLGRAADGSMRDALSLTDQAIAFGSGRLVATEVASMLGTVDRQEVFHLLTAVAKADAQEVYRIIDQLASYSPDYSALLDEMLMVLHKMAVYQVVPEGVDNSLGDRDKIASLSSLLSGEQIQLDYQIALTGKRDLPLVPDPKLGFEMTLIRMLAFELDDPSPPGHKQSESLGNAPEASAESSPLSAIKASMAETTSSRAVSEGHGSAQPLSVEGNVKFSPASADHADEDGQVSPLAEMSGPDQSSNSGDRQAQSIGLDDAPRMPVSSQSSDRVNSAFIQPKPTSMAKPSPQNNVVSLSANHERRSQAVSAAGAEVKTSASIVAEVPIETPVPPETQAPQARATTDKVSQLDKDWCQLLVQAGLGGVAYALASNCKLVARNNHHFELALDPAHSSLYNEIQVERIAEALTALLGQPAKASVAVMDGPGKSPAHLLAEQRSQALLQAEQTLVADPGVQQLMAGFDAKIVKGSITPLQAKGDG